MKVIINEKPIRLFEGARVKDAIRKFSEIYQEQMPESPYTIADAHGNIIRPEGRLSENDQLFIKPKKI